MEVAFYKIKSIMIFSKTNIKHRVDDFEVNFTNDTFKIIIY